MGVSVGDERGKGALAWVRVFQVWRDCGHVDETCVRLIWGVPLLTFASANWPHLLCSACPPHKHTHTHLKSAEQPYKHVLMQTMNNMNNNISLSCFLIFLTLCLFLSLSLFVCTCVSFSLYLSVQYIAVQVKFVTKTNKLFHCLYYFADETALRVIMYFSLSELFSEAP